MTDEQKEILNFVAKAALKVADRQSKKAGAENVFAAELFETFANMLSSVAAET